MSANQLSVFFQRRQSQLPFARLGVDKFNVLLQVRRSSLTAEIGGLNVEKNQVRLGG
jgi:hypothetical protein